MASKHAHRPSEALRSVRTSLSSQNPSRNHARSVLSWFLNHFPSPALEIRSGRFEGKGEKLQVCRFIRAPIDDEINPARSIMIHGGKRPDEGAGSGEWPRNTLIAPARRFAQFGPRSPFKIVEEPCPLRPLMVSQPFPITRGRNPVGCASKGKENNGGVPVHSCSHRRRDGPGTIHHDSWGGSARTRVRVLGNGLETRSSPQRGASLSSDVALLSKSSRNHARSVLSWFLNHFPSPAGEIRSGALRRERRITAGVPVHSCSHRRRDGPGTIHHDSWGEAPGRGCGLWRMASKHAHRPSEERTELAKGTRSGLRGCAQNTQLSRPFSPARIGTLTFLFYFPEAPDRFAGSRTAEALIK